MSKLNELVIRLEKLGGTIYADIKNGSEFGKVAINGAVFFALYPSGEFDRFDRAIKESDLRAGFKPVTNLIDPKTAKVLEKEEKARKIEELKTEEIYFEGGESEFRAAFGAISRQIGPIADYFISDRQRLIYVNDVLVRCAEFTVYLKNEEYTENDENGPEVHDPVKAIFIRSPKDGSIIYYRGDF